MHWSYSYRHTWQENCQGVAWSRAGDTFYRRRGWSLAYCLIILYYWPSVSDITWHNDERVGVSNPQRLVCLLNRLFKCISKKTSNLCVTGLCEGTSRRKASNAENVSIWWRHHGYPPVNEGLPSQSQEASNWYIPLTKGQQWMKSRCFLCC